MKIGNVDAFTVGIIPVATVTRARFATRSDRPYHLDVKTTRQGSNIKSRKHQHFTLRPVTSTVYRISRTKDMFYGSSI